MSKCVNSLRVCLVSSAAMKSTSFSTLIALNVMSSRLPIGVATRYNIDLFINFTFTIILYINYNIKKTAISSRFSKFLFSYRISSSLEI